jgi:hypothetical protein
MWVGRVQGKESKSRRGRHCQLKRRPNERRKREERRKKKERRSK